MLVKGGLDAGACPAVDTKDFVVGGDRYAFGPERRVLQEDARARVFAPFKRIHKVLLSNEFWVCMCCRPTWCGLWDEGSPRVQALLPIPL